MSCPFFTNKFPNEDSLIKYINENRALNITQNGCSLLLFACIKKYQTAAIKMLEKNPSQLNLSLVKDGKTALNVACYYGLVGVIDKLLDLNSIDILLNYGDSNGDTPISIICKIKNPISVNDKIDLLEKILDIHYTDLDLSKQNKQGNTPLMLMCSNPDLEDIALKTVTDYDLDRLNINAVNKNGENAETIAYENVMYLVYQEIIRLKRRHMPEEYEDEEDNRMLNEQHENSSYDYEDDDDYNEDAHGAIGDMPEIPEFKQQMIDLTKEAYDAIDLKNIKIQDYLNENKDNIVIKVGDEYYLSNREDIARQQNDAIVFECKNVNIKEPYNIITNLPLYNFKMIGINVPPEKVGIIPEYIYYYMKNVNGSNENGIQYVLDSNDQLFSVIPLHNKMLVSVISANEFNIGPNVILSGSLHCQAGQGGLSGIIVKAYASKGGKKSRKRTVKRITKTIKKRRGRKTIKK
jgi:ankyrin repeat protein